MDNYNYDYKYYNYDGKPKFPIKFPIMNAIYGTPSPAGTSASPSSANPGLSSINQGGEDLADTDTGSGSGETWLDKLKALTKNQAIAGAGRQVGSDISTLGSNLTSQKMLNDQLDKMSLQQGVQSAGTTLDSIMKMYKNRSANLASNRGLNAVAGL